jgi:hypothetical protein
VDQAQVREVCCGILSMKRGAPAVAVHARALEVLLAKRAHLVAIRARPAPCGIEAFARRADERRRRAGERDHLRQLHRALDQEWLERICSTSVRTRARQADDEDRVGVGAPQPSRSAKKLARV